MNKQGNNIVCVAISLKSNIKQLLGFSFAFRIKPIVNLSRSKNVKHVCIFVHFWYYLQGESFSW